MSSVPVISPTQLADGAAHTPLLDTAARPIDPVLAVDLDEPASPAVLGTAIRRARACDRLLVGIAGGRAATAPTEAETLAAALDMTLVDRRMESSGRPFVPVPDPAAALAGLAAAVAANPQAALVLAGLLRMAETLLVRDALDAESLAYSTLLGGAEFQRWLTARGPGLLPPPVPDPVLVARHGDVLEVTLNRPARRNAYDRQMRDALVEALHLAALDDTVTRVVLTGAGPAFCSGGDLDEFGTTPDAATAHLVRTRAGAGRLIHQLRDRTQVRVHGTCVGSGIELPAFAGTVLAAPGTTFRLPEVGMGLIPGAGGTVSIPRRIGRWRTLYLAISGTCLDATTALSWGLVDEVRA
ncbi:enoyl-CoA hydratase/isomerase family protein [Streptomyces himalayensis]|uniref:Enoyl-CoA hydratase/isomerase family protein n=1 Tax=Streptomyces himalayensis subsp. himalayensis TaxID=2756131 RepID=A0A7W0DMM2_9ACTN|nr:enoyl-CoA hydratase/isomerase family protein [Streptomyces himalayensis]MBA2947879.1 enoyl-CoA hydratase/isomerase family protein [Streptomyces himalayensis subsp. himalayensis]